MKLRWLGIVAVVAVASGIIVYKQLGAPPAVHEEQIVRPAVLLFADPREAESACGCGQIIRLVRAAGERGVPVREIAPGEDAEATRAHRVTVNPTVLFLDESGSVVARHEGEGSEVIEAVQAGLAGLAEGAR